MTTSAAAAEPHHLERLSTEAAQQQLNALPGWAIDGQQLRCTYQFANFVESIAFVNQLVPPAEAAGHHPDLDIRYSRVRVSLTTHDAGGLTQQDFDLAQAIARLNPAQTCQPDG